MAISTNGTVLARVAGALYNTQMSNATYNEVKTLDPASLADALYARDFSSSTDAAVATTLVTNLGLTSVTGLDNWVAAQLTAAGSHKGAKIVDLLNGFAQMTADATYGAAATAFNAKVDAALVLSQTTGNAGGTFAAAGVDLGSTFTLNANPGATYTGNAGNDTFNAANTIAAFDVINGGAGNDTLNIIDTGTNWQGAFPSTVTVSGVENMTLQTTGTVGLATAGSQAAFDVSAIAGLTALTVGASTGSNYIKAATTTNVSVSDTAGQVMVNGGKDVNVATTAGAAYVGYQSTGNTPTIATDVAASGAVRISTNGNNAVSVYGGTSVTTTSAAGVAVAKATGAINVTTTGANASTVTVKGGSTVNVTNQIAAANSSTIDVGRDIDATRANDVATDTAGKETFKATFLADLPTGNVTIVSTDGAATPAYGSGATGVYTNGSAAVAVTGGGSATIKDVNAIALAPATGVTAVSATNTLTSVSLTHTGGASTITSNALTSLSVSDQGQSVTVSAAAGTRTLNVTTNKLTGGTITDNTATGVVVTSTGSASSGVTLATDTATSVAFAGDKTISIGLSDTGSVTATVSSVTSTNTAGVTITTSLPTTTSFTGGDGNDVITIGATTKAISMGAGNNTVNTGATIGTGGSVNGGSGSADVLAISAADAATATASISSQAAFADKITGFERVSLSSATNQTVDLARLNNVSYVSEAGTGNTLTINNMTDNGTFAFTDASTATAVNVKDAAYSATNTLNVVITSSGAVNAGILQADGVENIKITATDTDTTAHTDQLALRDSAVKTITVAGNSALTLTHNTDGTTVTGVDASAATGAFGYTAPAFAAAATVTGSSTAANAVTLTAAAAVVTYNGGAVADDVVIANTNSLANVINLGEGTNSLKGSTAGTLSTAAAGNNTVTGGSGVDTIELYNGNNIVNTLAGDDVVKVGNGNNTITLGDGADQVTVGSGSNVITLGAGADTVTLAAINANSANVYSTIADFAVGDKIQFIDQGTPAPATLGAKITGLAGTATFTDYLNAAAAIADTSNNSQVAWFQYGGDTFIVVDFADTATPGDGASFLPGKDQVVKLTGLLDLSASTVSAASLLTFVATA